MKLKPKNRTKLENWFADYLMNNIEWYKDRVIHEICLFGIKGVKDYTDKELFDEYKEYVYNTRSYKARI